MHLHFYNLSFTVVFSCGAHSSSVHFNEKAKNKQQLWMKLSIVRK